MINIEKTFKAILKNWGYDVYIQRKLVNGNYSETLEKVTTRSVFPKGRANSQAMQEEEEGIVHNYDVTYYFESEVNPKEGDRIYEHLPNAGRKQTVFIVDAASPNRGRLGKISYWIVGATKEKQV